MDAFMWIIFCSFATTGGPFSAYPDIHNRTAYQTQEMCEANLLRELETDFQVEVNQNGIMTVHLNENPWGDVASVSRCTCYGIQYPDW